MVEGFYPTPRPTDLTNAIAKETKLHKDNSLLTAGALERKCHRLAFAFLTEGMAITEDCPDGQGGVIKRRIGVQMWEQMMRDIPEPARDMIWDPPTPEKMPARGKKARAKDVKTKIKKDREAEEEESNLGNTDADIATHLPIGIDDKTAEFILENLEWMKGVANRKDMGSRDARHLLLNTLYKLEEDDFETLLTQSEWVNLEMAMSAAKERLDILAAKEQAAKVKATKEALEAENAEE